MGINRTDPEISERKGLEHYRLAMRSENLAAFRKEILQARSAYSAASHRSRPNKHRGTQLRCRAWIQLLNFFLATKASAKKRFLDESWRLTKHSLHVFNRDADNIEFANTYDQLATSVGLAYDFHWDVDQRLRRVDEGIDYGRRAIKRLSPTEHPQLLSRILVRIALFMDTQGDYPFRYDVEKIDKEALEHWKTAEKLDKQAALLQVGYPPPGFYRLLSDQEGAQVCNEALKLAKLTGDNFSIGWQLDQAAVRKFFEAFRHADDAERTRVVQESLGFAEEAQHYHSIMNFVTPNCGVQYPGSPYTEHFKFLSRFQADPAKRRNLLEKSRAETPNLFRVAKKSGYPVVNAYAHRIASGTLTDLAEWSTNPKEKRRMLKESLNHCAKAASIATRAKRGELAPISIVLRATAQAKIALADLEPNHKKKIRLLKAAITDSQRSVRLYTTYLDNVAKGEPHVLQRAGAIYQQQQGDMLTRLYDLTRDERLLSKIVKVFSDAANNLKAGNPTKELGLAYWKAAEASDLQQTNVAAAEYFGLAAKTYLSIKSINPQIDAIFQDYARYMEAWGNIEKAKAAHKRLAYDEAEKFYQQVATLFQTTDRWRFFTAYYEAFAKLEAAENLSKLGECFAAGIAFGEAADQFKQSSALLAKGALTLSEPQERSTVQLLTTSFNAQYCLGRQLIEDARQAEDQGDHQTSARRFGEAAKILERAAKKSGLKREKNELLYISTLAKAWEEMARSYSSGTPRISFLNAISLFEKSLNYLTDENTRNVSLGHRHFCEALAASEEFDLTLSTEEYKKGFEHFKASATHFATAGFNVQSVHARACGLLLDAHQEIAKSSTADLLPVADRHRTATELLDEAAEAFARSHQVAKQRQVLSLLDGVKEQHGFGKRFATMSRTMSRLSPAVAFPSPAGGDESPFGHSRFAGPHIDVDYSLSTISAVPEARERSVKVRIANIGSEPIQLVRIENVLPENVRVTRVSVNATRALRSMIPVQKKTPPMDVDTFDFTLGAGEDPAIIKPTIVYLDEKGHERSHELPARIVASSPVLDYLTQEFRTDYSAKRLAPEYCGWRTIPSICRTLKVPRSHFYGERRWGHVFSRSFEAMLKAEIVECRTFPGERGRGGQILKVRLAYDTDITRLYLRDNGITWT